jgi:hypothetical protein
MALLNQRGAFSIQGFRAMRNNPDGTTPTPSRLIGFLGTCDLTAIGTDEVGSMTIKIDGGAEETKDVDFSGASSLAAVTVAEAFAALNTAAFTDMTWSADSTTGRLKGVCASGTYVQIYGDLAPLLDFGYGIAHGGQGTKFVKAFTDTVSIGLPKNLKAREEIETESGDGTLSTMIIEAIMKGVNPAIVMNKKDYDLIELIQGGTYDRTLNTYDPPNASVTTHPTFWLDVFSPIYTAGTKLRENKAGYERVVLRNCSGVESDLSHETKAWATYGFDVTAADYEDESGNVSSAFQESTPTIAQFTTLDPANV